MEVPALPFEAFNLLGTLAWAAALSGLGYAFGSEWDKVSKNFSRASDALAVLVVLMLAGLIAHKAREIRKERREDAAAAAAGAVPGGASATRPAGLSQDGQSNVPPAAPARPHSHRRNSGS